jgi:glucan biosynthesis protein C
MSTTIPRFQAAAVKIPRILFLDNLRSAIIVLVILHHIAVMYSGSGAFYYIEPGDTLANDLLAVFTAFNQAWFMGAFFLLSGYFSPGSFDRKGAWPFLKDRFIRLGIPLVFFFFVLNPVAVIVGVNATPSGITGITTMLTWHDYSSLVGMGPLWFVEMLLIFDIGYVVWRQMTAGRASQPNGCPAPPSYLKMGVFILALAVTSYLIRIPISIDRAIAGFPTLGYFPEYLSFFCIGVIAARGDWLRAIPGSMAKWGLVAAAAVTFTLFLLATAGTTPGTSPPLLGNGTWQSAAYALWDSTFAVGVFTALILFFRRFLDFQGRLGRFLYQHSYTVFVIHAPILTLLAVWLLRDLDVEHLLKFALLAVIAVPLCFALAYLIRKIPFV